MSNRSERKAWIDFARACGIFAIVYGHLVQGNSVISQFFGSFRVAIFFCVMGLTFRYARGFFSFLKSKAVRLLIPYGFFSAVSILVFAFIGRIYPEITKGQSTAILKNLLGALYGNGLAGNMKWNLPLWFLPCGFITMVMIYAVEGLIQKAADSRKSGFRVLYVLLVFAANVLYCKWFKAVKLPFGAEVALSMSGFVEIGILLAGLDGIKRKASGGITGILLIALGFFLSMQNGDVSVVSLNFGTNILVYYIVAIIDISGIFLVSIWLCSINVLDQTRKAICYCGRHTLAILCMHKFPVLLFQLVIPFTNGLFRAYEDSLLKNAAGLIGSIVVIVLCLAVELPIERFAPAVLGKDRGVPRR